MFATLALALSVIPMLDIWALLTLCLEASESGLRWRAAFRRGQLDWSNIKSITYLDNLRQIHMLPIGGRVQRMSTASLPKEALARVRGAIAERVPADAVIAGHSTLGVWGALGILFFPPAVHVAAYVVVWLGFANGDYSGSFASLWLGLGLFSFLIPLVAGLPAAGVYWVFRRKYLRATMWIIWIVWLLFVGMLFLAAVLPPLPAG